MIRKHLHQTGHPKRKILAQAMARQIGDGTIDDIATTSALGSG